MVKPAKAVGIELEPEELESIRKATEELGGKPVKIGPLPQYVIDAMRGDDDDA